MFKLAMFAILSTLALGCQTQFTGDPKFPSGVSGCKATCRASGMVMLGFVYSGEYSTSCVCGPASSSAAPGSQRAASNVRVVMQAAAVAAANAGVAMQQQRAARARSGASATGWHPGHAGVAPGLAFTPAADSGPR